MSKSKFRLPSVARIKNITLRRLVMLIVVPLALALLLGTIIIGALVSAIIAALEELLNHLHHSYVLYIVATFKAISDCWSSK